MAEGIPGMAQQFRRKLRRSLKKYKTRCLTKNNEARIEKL